MESWCLWGTPLVSLCLNEHTYSPFIDIGAFAIIYMMLAKRPGQFAGQMY